MTKWEDKTRELVARIDATKTLALTMEDMREGTTLEGARLTDIKWSSEPADRARVITLTNGKQTVFLKNAGGIQPKPIGPTKYYCAGTNCPGYPYKASERRHPEECYGVDLDEMRRDGGLPDGYMQRILDTISKDGCGPFGSDTDELKRLRAENHAMREWFEGMQDDFRGVIVDHQDPDTFHSWGWINEHRPFPSSELLDCKEVKLAIKLLERHYGGFAYRLFPTDDVTEFGFSTFRERKLRDTQ